MSRSDFADCAAQLDQSNSGVTVQHFSRVIVLEPVGAHRSGPSVTLKPTLWGDWLDAVEVLRRRAGLKTRGEAGLAMILAGLPLESGLRPPGVFSRLMRRQMDLARGLAREPAVLVLNRFFRRLDRPAATLLVHAMHEIAHRGVACYLVAGNAREAAVMRHAVGHVFGRNGLANHPAKGFDRIAS